MHICVHLLCKEAVKRAEFLPYKQRSSTMSETKYLILGTIVITKCDRCSSAYLNGEKHS